MTDLPAKLSDERLRELRVATQQELDMADSGNDLEARRFWTQMKDALLELNFHRLAERADGECEHNHLLRLIDAVWQAATDSQEVPSVAWADELLDKWSTDKQPLPAPPAERAKDAYGLESRCEFCGHLGVTPEGWCVDCDWRSNGIKVAAAYLDLASRSPSRDESLRAALEKARVEFDYLSNKRMDYSYEDRCRWHALSNEADAALAGRFPEAK